MNNVFDTKERIARSNIYSIFGKFIRRQIDNNDDGEVLLKKLVYPLFGTTTKIN
ncbi:hypothetical protein [Ruminococcus sp.]